MYGVNSSDGGHVERLAAEDARHVLERPALHPLEVVRVADARERHDQVRAQIPERPRDQGRLQEPPSERRGRLASGPKR